MGPTEQLTLIDDRYEVVGPLDEGGMGVVYRALDRRLGRPVAVKLVRTTDPVVADRLMLEARLLARLDHPNVVRVYDAGTHLGRPYIVTELVPGPPVSELVRRSPIGSADSAAIGAAAAAGLAASHAAGIVHRDLKPANILISELGIVRLLDYGVASSADAGSLTVDGEVVGTPRYLAPEQVAGEVVGPAADVYALGLVLLECLTGARPFGGTVVESMTARLVSAPEIPATLDPPWQPVLAAMTGRLPASRPSARRVGELLAPLGSGSDLVRLAAAGGTTTSTTGTISTSIDSSTDFAGPRADATLVMAAAVTPTSERPVVAGERRPRSRRRRWLVAVIALALLAAGGAAAGAVALADRSSPATSPSTTAPTTIPPSTPTTRAPVAVTKPSTTTTTKPSTTTTTEAPATTTTTNRHGRPGKGGKPRP